jgi:hypothetical protein
MTARRPFLQSAHPGYFMKAVRHAALAEAIASRRRLVRAVPMGNSDDLVALEERLTVERLGWRSRIRWRSGL